MIKLTRVLICFILASVLANGRALSLPPQKGNPDRLGDLILDVTTPEMAINTLGQPASEKMGKLDASKLDKWLDPKHDEKIFRQLHFTDPGPSFATIDLSFFENKLVMVVVMFKKEFQPVGLEPLFGVRFIPLGGPVMLRDTPGVYPNQSMVVTSYGPSHGEIGISDKSFIYAYCVSGDSTSRGRVDTLRLVSRTLEDKTKLNNAPTKRPTENMDKFKGEVCTGKTIGYDPKTYQLSVACGADGKTEVFTTIEGLPLLFTEPNGLVRKLAPSDIKTGTPIIVYYHKDKKRVNGVTVTYNRLYGTATP